MRGGDYNAVLKPAAKEASRTYQAAASAQIQTPFACPPAAPPLKEFGYHNGAIPHCTVV